MVADRVRIVGSSAPPTPPPEGVDPLGYVQQWIDKTETWMNTWFITNPRDASWSEQSNYDGQFALWFMSKFLASSNPSLATTVFDRCVSVSDAAIAIHPGLTSDPTASNVSPSNVAGFYCYNIGPRMLGQDAGCPAGKVVQAMTQAANYARGSAYAGQIAPIYYYVFGDNTWPSGTTASNPANPPFSCREWALATLAHMVVDDVYADYEERLYNGYEYVESHRIFIPRIIGRWFFGQGVAGDACIDQWRDIGAQVDAAAGDWTQVPDSWSVDISGNPLPEGTSHEFCPFMFCHVARMLIYYYEHTSDFSFTGKPWGDEISFKPLVLQAIKDLCDMSIDWWQKPDAWGNNALMYRIKETGIEDTYGAADLGMWEFPMFAWVYSKTGQIKYKTMATDLIKSGLENGYLGWAKNLYEQSIWVWHGFQWLGWTGTTFEIPWLAGGDAQFEPLS